MAPRTGEPADQPERTSIDAMAEATHIAQQIAGGNEDDRRMVAESIGPYIYAYLNARIQGDVRDDRKIRVTSDGADVTSTAAGTQIKFPGESYFDHLNFAGMTLDVQSSTAGRRVNIQGNGGGTDCMWDFIVSSCFSTLAGFTEGMSRDSLSGCPFLCYSTFQGVSDWLDANSTNGGEYSVLLCGITSESVTLNPGTSSKYDGLYVYGGGQGVSGITGTLTVAGTPGSGTRLHFYDCVIPTYTTASGDNMPGRFERCEIGNITSTGSGLYLGLTCIDCFITGSVTCSGSLASWEHCAFRNCTIGGSIDLSTGVQHTYIYVEQCTFKGSTSQIKIIGNGNYQLTDNVWHVSGAYTATQCIALTCAGTTVFNVVIADNRFPRQATAASAMIDFVGTGIVVAATITGNAFPKPTLATSYYLRSGADVSAIVSVTGNDFNPDNDTPRFLETAGGISITGKFIYSTFGPNIPSDFDLELLAGSSTNLYLGLGTVSGAGAGSATIINAPHAILDGSVHSDSVAQGVTRGSLIYGNSTPKWDELVIGTANKVLHSDGTDVSWQSLVAADIPVSTLYSITDYAMIPDAAPGAVVTAGDQQGAIVHSGPALEFAFLLMVDAETAPGASGLPITFQYGDTNDLDTVAVWTTIATVTLSSEKSTSTSSMTNTQIPANRLIRMNVGTIVGSPADVTATLRVYRPLST